MPFLSFTLQNFRAGSIVLNSAMLACAIPFRRPRHSTNDGTVVQSKEIFASYTFIDGVRRMLCVCAFEQRLSVCFKSFSKDTEWQVDYDR